MTSIREKDVFVVQSGSSKINDSIMELLILISACKGGSANKITGQSHPTIPSKFEADLLSRFTVFPLQQAIEEEIPSRSNHGAYACESSRRCRNQTCHHDRPS